MNMGSFLPPLASAVIAALLVGMPIGPAGAAGPPLTRLAVLGDSITAGVGASDAAHRYSSVLADLLRARNPGLTEVNLGLSGSALGWQKPDYPERVLANNPDAVVIQWGVNDYYWGFSVAQFVRNYDRLLAALRQAQPDLPIVVTTLVADFRYPENQDMWIGEANVGLQELACTYGCYLADLHRALNHDRSLYSDAIHPNDAGMKLMAETIARALAGAPAAAGGPWGVSFDRGAEVRFLQYVFYPALPDAAPHWTEVTQLSREGMVVSTEVPLLVRTAPGLPAGERVLEVRNEAGDVVDTVKATLTWAPFLSFRVDPQGKRQTFRITIR